MVFSWIHNNIWDTNFPSGRRSTRCSGTGCADSRRTRPRGADGRIRLIGVTRTARGTVLARLQSLAESEVTVGVIAGSDVAEAWRASVIGVRRAPIEVDGRRVELQMPRFGTTALELRLE
ncbi:hypothetical protein [Diaminobutyricibacter sp. McL0608]|uniref:hypothetical protein n=1 Tax=Leifsonia sp. McL0608 TaxID=3143537 RepID=UPI0031F2EF05